MGIKEEERDPNGLELKSAFWRRRGGMSGRIDTGG